MDCYHHAEAEEASVKKPITLIRNMCLVTLVTALSAAAQPAPQTARQALLEMLFSKTPGGFEKHLPQATLAALAKAGTKSGTSFLSAFSLLSSNMTAHGGHLQTFEAGPTLLLLDDPQAHNKFEITVEGDDLRNDEDQIDLSFRTSTDGAAQAGVKVRLTLIMKQETGIWRLNDVSVTIGASLSDPDFLKAITAKLGTGISGDTPGHPATSVGTNPMLIAVNESAAVAAVRTFNTAEINYNATFPARGFTCTLADLGGMGSGGGMNEHQAMLIDPRLASGKKNGYVFALTGCNGIPATSYNITAEPANPSAGTRAFCSDQSAVIHFSADGKAYSCLNAGIPLQ
jgi:hypothetical protein